MQLKEFLRNILSPKFFYFLVDIKNSIFPNKSYLEAKSGLKNGQKFYRQFVSPGDMVFDIGSNYGNRVKLFLSLNAKVIAVEPQAKCIQFMRSLFGKKIVLVEKGLGDKPGSMDFFMSDNAALSTFSEDWINKMKSSNRFNEFEWKEPVRIPITTLDILIAEFGIPQFIKIDVEGLEFKVLKGLSIPVNGLSIEYAVPENADELKNCIELMGTIGNYKVNYSPGETLELALQNWISIEDFLSFSKTDDFIKTSAGDIYFTTAND